MNSTTDQRSGWEAQGRSGKFSSISSRLLIYILMVSSVITLLATGIQLYLDYKTDLEEIEKRLIQIEKINLPTITNSLWNVDRSSIKTHLHGILTLHEIQYLVVRDEAAEVFVSVGIPGNESAISRLYPIRTDRVSAGVDPTIGELEIIISLSGVYSRLIDKFLVILGT
jgi:hypothetical protein